MFLAVLLVHLQVHLRFRSLPSMSFFRSCFKSIPACLCRSDRGSLEVGRSRLTDVRGKGQCIIFYFIGAEEGVVRTRLDLIHTNCGCTLVRMTKGFSLSASQNFSITSEDTPHTKIWRQTNYKTTSASFLSFSSI